MSAWQALFWGGFSSASLYIGEVLACPMAKLHRATGLVMGFGAGTLLRGGADKSRLSSPASRRDRSSDAVSPGLRLWAQPAPWPTSCCPTRPSTRGPSSPFGLGAIVYFVGDRPVDKGGGDERQQIETASADSSGVAMFLGALLDGLPEAFVLGIGIQLGGAISVAFVAAVFISNVPQGIAGTTSLQDAGYADRTIFRMWTALTVAAALTALVGYAVGDMVPANGVYAQAFAAGAVLTMLADSMMPEAFEHGGKWVGVLTALGYAVATALTVLQ